MRHSIKQAKTNNTVVTMELVTGNEPHILVSGTYIKETDNGLQLLALDEGKYPLTADTSYAMALSDFDIIALTNKEMGRIFGMDYEGEIYKDLYTPDTYFLRGVDKALFVKSYENEWYKIDKNGEEFCKSLAFVDYSTEKIFN